MTYEEAKQQLDAGHIIRKCAWPEGMCLDPTSGEIRLWSNGTCLDVWYGDDQRLGTDGEWEVVK